MEKINLPNYKLYKIKLKAKEKEKYFHKINEIFDDLLVAINETNKYLVINDISDKMLFKIIGFWGECQRLGYDSYKCKITAYLIKRIYKLYKNIIHRKEIKMFGKKELEKVHFILKKENKKLTDSYGKSKSHELEEQISKLEKTIENLKLEVDRLESRNREIESQKNQIMGNYNLLNINFDNLKVKYDKDEELIKKQMNELEENAQFLDQHNEKINKLNQQIKEKDIEISAYKNAISNISFTFNNDGKINPKDFDINDYIVNEGDKK